MLDLKVIIGSTRPGRAADRVIPWITAVARAHGAFGVDVIDLRDWELPLFGETFAAVGDPGNPTFSVPAVKRWNPEDRRGRRLPRRAEPLQGGPHRTSERIEAPGRRPAVTS
jgi:hypothetical protein